MCFHGRALATSENIIIGVDFRSASWRSLMSCQQTLDVCRREGSPRSRKVNKQQSPKCHLISREYLKVKVARWIPRTSPLEVQLKASSMVMKSKYLN